jgi:hypothetical protein
VDERQGGIRSAAATQNEQPPAGTAQNSHERLALSLETLLLFVFFPFLEIQTSDNFSLPLDLCPLLDGTPLLPSAFGASFPTIDEPTWSGTIRVLSRIFDPGVSPRPPNNPEKLPRLVTSADRLVQEAKGWPRSI